MSGALWYYLIAFAVSFLLTGVYVTIWHRHFDTHLTVIFLIIPITMLAYYLMYFYHTREAVVLRRR